MNTQLGRSIDTSSLRAVTAPRNLSAGNVRMMYLEFVDGGESHFDLDVQAVQMLFVTKYVELYCILKQNNNLLN